MRIRLMEFCLAASLAAGAVTVTPVETKEALVNPDMGLVCYNMAGRMWAYGARTAPGDTLDWFPGVSTIYFRFLWSELEPTEGDYRWDMIDAIAQNWIAKGKKLAFRVICCNSTDNACPDYVREAGAKGTWFRYAGHGVPADFPLRWEPIYDDPVFLAKYEAFLKAFAARYDGNPDVAFVDVGSFGMYGEGHTGQTSKLSKEETDRITRLHLQLHRRLLPKTLLVISDDVAGSGGQEPEAPLMKFARELGIGYRDDSIFCMGPETNSFAREGSWAHSHWARNFAPETPVVIETGHWSMCREKGRFIPERLLDCVEKHQASYLSIHFFPEPYYAALKDEMAKVNLRLGYRFALKSVEYPEKVKAGEKVAIRSTWVNRGVSWLHGGASLTWSLLDEKGTVCWSTTDPAFNFRVLDPTLGGVEKPKTVVSPCRFGRDQPIFKFDPVYVSVCAAGYDPGDRYVMLKSGVYTLAVSVGSNQGTPQIALPLERGVGRRYPIGKIEVVAGEPVREPVRTKEAAAVLRNLQALPQEGRFAYAWCHPWVENAPEYRCETSSGPVPKPAADIDLGKGFGRHIDKTPLLYFTDFYFVTDTTKPAEEVAKSRASLAGMVRAAWRQYRSVPVFSWHAENPHTPKGWWDPKYGAAPYRYRYSSKGYPQEHRYVFREILAGDAFARGWYDRSLETIAAFLRDLKAEDGTPIPCIVRLFHECEDDWQWWGRNSVSNTDYKALFRLTVETLRAKTGGGANLLFAYSPDRYWKTLGSPDSPADFLYRYPGDDVVDIVGHDDYSLGDEKELKVAEGELEQSIRRSRLVSAFAREHGKAAGLFETGVKGTRDDAYDFIFRMMTAEGVDYGFVCTWGGVYSMPASEAGKACWRRFANRPEVVVFESGRNLVR